MFKIIIYLAILIITMPVKGQVEANAPHKNKAIKFLPNQGQIGDRNYQPRPDVLFHVEGKGIYLKDNGITYIMVDPEDLAQLTAEEEEDEAGGGSEGDRL